MQDQRSVGGIVCAASDLAETYGYGLCKPPAAADKDAVLARHGLTDLGDRLPGPDDFHLDPDLS